MRRPVAILAATTALSLLAPQEADAHSRRRKAKVRRAKAVKVVAPPPEVALAIRDAFGDRSEQALTVARCESGFAEGARNGVHVGLFQLSGRYHRTRAARLGYDWSQMTQARPNAVVAADLQAEQSWRPWSCRPW